MKPQQAKPHWQQDEEDDIIFEKGMREFWRILTLTESYAAAMDAATVYVQEQRARMRRLH